MRQCHHLHYSYPPSLHPTPVQQTDTFGNMQFMLFIAPIFTNIYCVRKRFKSLFSVSQVYIVPQSLQRGLTEHFLYMKVDTFQVGQYESGSWPLIGQMKILTQKALERKKSKYFRKD